MSAPYRFERSGRNLPALLVLLAVWGILLLAWWKLAAADWIVAGLLALTLPAAWDFGQARAAGLELDETQLRWWSGRHEGDVVLSAIEEVRFETRFDMSVRVRLVLRTADARRLVLPQDSLPPWQALQEALQARGVKANRHPFALF